MILMSMNFVKNQRNSNLMIKKNNNFMAAKKSAETKEKETTVKKRTKSVKQVDEPVKAFVHTEQHHVQCGDETSEQYRQRLQNIVDEYEKDIASATDLVEMEKDFNDIRKRRVEVVEMLKKTELHVSESVEFNGKTYTRKDVGDKIVFFITKDPVGFPEIQTMMSIKDYWSNPTDSIPFMVYDATVKALDNTKYRGVVEWEGIMMVSAFFKTMSEPYSIANITLSYWDAKSSVLENRARDISGK